MKKIIWLLVLVLIGCSRNENAPQGVQPSEVFISQGAVPVVTLDQTTLEKLTTQKIEVLSAPLNEDGSHPYFFIHEVSGETKFVVEGTYHGKAFQFELAAYDERLAFADGVAFCKTLIKEETPTWECSPISFD